MKANYLSALLLSAAISSPAYAVLGEDYIQSSDITYKIFNNVDSENGECDIEERTYYKNKEERNIYSSADQSHCSEFKFTKEIGSSSLRYIKSSTTEDIWFEDEYGNVYSGISYISESYDQGIPVIREQMELNDFWTESSDITVKNKTKWDQTAPDTNLEFDGYRIDKFTVVSIDESYELLDESYEKCIKLYWDSFTSHDFSEYGYGDIESSEDIHLWFCPKIGLVKYELINHGITFELTGHSTDEVYTEGMEGGSGDGGGGSLPLSILTILGLVAVRRK